MNKKRLYWVGVVVILIIIALALIFKGGGKDNLAAVGSAGTPIVCPIDTFICPNNEKVGRVLPTCQFAQCPIATDPSPAALFKD